MENHDPRRVFWQAGFYVSYQTKQPDAQDSAVFQ